jgi:integrase
MRATKLHKLTQLNVKNAPAFGPGAVMSDGGGLYVRNRLYVFRYTSPLTGKERDFSLGSVDALTLKTAREIASGHRERVACGVDPFEHRDSERLEAKLRAAKARTFGEVAAQWIETKLPERKAQKNVKPLAKALKTYTKKIAAIPMAAVTSDDIASALKVLADRPAIRDTTISLIHTIFDWAMAADIIPEALNPARAKKLGKLLPKRTSEVQHNRFLPAAELPAFMARVAAIPGTLARAFEFLVHSGLRQIEVMRLEWDWVDLDARTISFPASAMKAGTPHFVYLSDHAAAIIEAMLPLRRPHGCVFPGYGRDRRTLSDRSLRSFLQKRFPELAHLQVHGTRACLKTWATTTHHRREIIEITLAHRVGGVVEASYFDTEAPEIRAARVALYRDWSAFLTSASPKPDAGSAPDMTVESEPDPVAAAPAPGSNVAALRQAA